MVAEPGRELDQLTHDVIGAAIEVHRELGPGFMEGIYEEALCLALTRRSIAFVRQHVIRVTFQGHEVGEHRLDLIVDGQLIVELKAVEQLAPIHLAQVRSYLKATGHKLGLLINFNVPVLRDGIKRIIRS